MHEQFAALPNNVTGPEKVCRHGSKYFLYRINLLFTHIVDENNRYSTYEKVTTENFSLIFLQCNKC